MPEAGTPDNVELRAGNRLDGGCPVCRLQAVACGSSANGKGTL